MSLHHLNLTVDRTAVVVAVVGFAAVVGAVVVVGAAAAAFAAAVAAVAVAAAGLAAAVGAVVGAAAVAVAGLAVVVAAVAAAVVAAAATVDVVAAAVAAVGGAVAAHGLAKEAKRVQLKTSSCHWEALATACADERGTQAVHDLILPCWSLENCRSPRPCSAAPQSVSMRTTVSAHLEEDALLEMMLWRRYVVYVAARLWKRKDPTPCSCGCRLPWLAES